jgi:uncharacterized protein with PQ loop repeat
MKNSNDNFLESSSYSYNYILKIAIDLIMIFVPSVGYFFQAMKFKQTKSTKGFAKFLCFLLLIANILRCIFWLGKKFNLTLLFQAIVVIISQIYLIHIYFQYQDELPFKSENKPLCEYLLNWKETLNPYHIWNWSDEIEYYKFTFFFFLINLLICFLFGFDNTTFFDIIGTISVSCETFIELPQIKENCITKNTQNLSGTMVLMWFIGDLFKTWYNFIYKSPWQMIIGGVIMNCEDIVLNTQVIIYSEDNFIGKIIFRKKQRYVTLDDDRGANTSNKIDFDGDKNNNEVNA